MKVSKKKKYGTVCATWRRVIVYKRCQHCHSSTISVLFHAAQSAVRVRLCGVLSFPISWQLFQKVCMCLACWRWFRQCCGGLWLYWSVDSRRLCRGFVRHSLSDTSFNSWGLVPGSHLLCNYIVLQHICTQVHTHAGRHTHTHTHTHKYLFPFLTSSWICTHVPTRAHAVSQRQPHQIISQSVMFIWGIETERQSRSEGRSAKQSEKHQRQ